jgi:Flp pilus assembly protein TadD
MAGENEFELGLQFFRDGYVGKALEQMKAAAEAAPQNAMYMSYLGLLVAAAQKDFDKAEQICQMALKLDRGEPQCYLNMAEVYTRARRPAEAMEALREGLQRTKRDKRIADAIARLSGRRQPVFPFLDREHPLNMVLGRIRHQILGPVGGKKAKPKTPGKKRKT